VRIGVLGPVAAWDADGVGLDLKGPRHRAVLARLAVARGRVVPLGVLIDDLWETPPGGATGAIRTFVADLRRALEPGRVSRVPPAPRAAFLTLVTEGPGYALRTEPGNLDARRFESLVTEAAAAAPARVLELAGEGLGCWRGPAYAEFADAPWAVGEGARLTELRLDLVERQAQARLALGLAADAVPDLGAHLEQHPWREDAWRLLAVALYRAERQAEALAVLRRARTRLGELGLEPGERLAALEEDILRHAPHLDSLAGDVWAVTVAAYQRTGGAFTRTRLEAAATLAGSLALTGGPGLTAAMSQRLAAIEAAERLGDPELTARVIGNFDVPAVWTRSDDPVAAARIVAAAERTLPLIPADGRNAMRARLLVTIAIESRGSAAARPAAAAAEAEAIARRLGDPALLACALGGVWMQGFARTGLAPGRNGTGAEIVAIATRHGLVTFEILGRLIRLQALSALGDFTAADAHACALDQLGGVHERPLVGVFTGWYRAMRAAAAGASLPESDALYRRAATLLDGCGMPGVERGLLPLALLCLRVWRRGTVPPDPSDADTGAGAGLLEGADWGPYEAWARPWLLLARDRPAQARNALRRVPAPPPGQLAEALWCVTARAADLLGDPALARRARDALRPAAGEIAGAGSGMLTAGPVRDYLAGAA